MSNPVERNRKKKRTWQCTCGKIVRGSSGIASHQRSCETWKASAPKKTRQPTPADTRFLASNFVEILARFPCAWCGVDQEPHDDDCGALTFIKGSRKR